MGCVGITDLRERCRCSSCTIQFHHRSFWCEHLHCYVLNWRWEYGRTEFDTWLRSSQVSTARLFPIVCRTSTNEFSDRYLSAPSVAEKSNVTWAGQTFGAQFEADGRLSGTESVQTIQCDAAGNTCQVQVPAPGFALVFLSSNAFSESNPSTTQTFSTTSVTKKGSTATINPSVLATSNGHSGSSWHLSSTSKENVSGASRAITMPGGIALLAMISGAIVMCRALLR